MTLGAVFSSGSRSIIDLDATLFIQLGVFLCMFFLLRALVFKPMLRLMQARREATEGALERAAELESEAEKLCLDVEAQLLDARIAATKERARAVEQARAQERESFERSRAEVRETVVAAREHATVEAESARRALREQATELASAAASRALGRPV